MYILYRHPETKALTVTDVTNTQYLPEEQTLTFFGDDDVSIAVSRSRSDELIRQLYEDGKLDISSYDCVFYEWDDDDDDEYEEDEDVFTIDPDLVIQI